MDRANGDLPSFVPSFERNQVSWNYRNVVYDALAIHTKIKKHEIILKSDFTWEVVVAQLVERLFLTPEFRGSNPATGNFNYYLLTALYLNCIEKTKIKKTGGRERLNFIQKSSMTIKKIILASIYALCTLNNESSPASFSSIVN